MSTTSNFTPRNYADWISNPLINPKTGRAIKRDGPTYLAIKEGYDKYSKKQKNSSSSSSKCNFTSQDYANWIDNPLINPQTGKTIKRDGPTYEAIVKGCGEYYKSKYPSSYISHKSYTSPYTPSPSSTLESNSSSYKSLYTPSLESNSSPKPPQQVKIFPKSNPIVDEYEPSEDLEIQGVAEGANQLFSWVSRIVTNMFSITCGTSTPCSFSNCRWKGIVGINFEASGVPPFIKKMMTSAILSTTRESQKCCCFCVYHFGIITAFLLDKHRTTICTGAKMMGWGSADPVDMRLMNDIIRSEKLINSWEAPTSSQENYVRTHGKTIFGQLLQDTKQGSTKAVKTYGVSMASSSISYLYGIYKNHKRDILSIASKMACGLEEEPIYEEDEYTD